MNNLTAYMDARGITPKELSEKTGISINNIRRLMNTGNLESAYTYTKTAIAEALGVSVCDLVKGGENMKKKILETEVTKAAEHLAKVIREFSGEPMHLSLAIFTRDIECKCDGDPNGLPDYYSVLVHDADTEYDDNPEGYIPRSIEVSKTGRIYYGDDGCISEVKGFGENDL